jgi:hypothetical protein
LPLPRFRATRREGGERETRAPVDVSEETTNPPQVTRGGLGVVVGGGISAETPCLPRARGVCHPGLTTTYLDPACDVAKLGEICRMTWCELRRGPRTEPAEPVSPRSPRSPAAEGQLVARLDRLPRPGGPQVVRAAPSAAQRGARPARVLTATGRRRSAPALPDAGLITSPIDRIGPRDFHAAIWE